MAKLAFKPVNFQSSALNNYTALKNNKIIWLICGILKMIKWTYLENRNKPSDTENKEGYRKGKEGG